MCFEVDTEANKIQIKEAVEVIFDVEVQESAHDDSASQARTAGTGMVHAHQAVEKSHCDPGSTAKKSTCLLRS